MPLHVRRRSNPPLSLLRHGRRRRCRLLALLHMLEMQWRKGRQAPSSTARTTRHQHRRRRRRRRSRRRRQRGPHGDSGKQPDAAAAAATALRRGRALLLSIAPHAGRRRAIRPAGRCGCCCCWCCGCHRCRQHPSCCRGGLLSSFSSSCCPAAAAAAAKGTDALRDAEDDAALPVPGVGKDLFDFDFDRSIDRAGEDDISRLEYKSDVIGWSWSPHRQDPLNLLHIPAYIHTHTKNAPS